MGISFEFWNIYIYIYQPFFSSFFFEDRRRINIDDGWLIGYFRLPTLLILAPVIFYVNQNSSKKFIKFPEHFNESPLNLVEGRTSPNSVENLGHHLTSWNDLTLQVIRGEKKTTRSRETKGGNHGTQLDRGWGLLKPW